MLLEADKDGIELAPTWYLWVEPAIVASLALHAGAILWACGLGSFMSTTLGAWTLFWLCPGPLTREVSALPLRSLNATLDWGAAMHVAAFLLVWPPVTLAGLLGLLPGPISQGSVQEEVPVEAPMPLVCECYP